MFLGKIHPYKKKKNVISIGLLHSVKFHLLYHLNILQIHPHSSSLLFLARATILGNWTTAVSSQVSTLSHDPLQSIPHPATSHWPKIQI